jgi:hypothetical protein
MDSIRVRRDAGRETAEDDPSAVALRGATVNQIATSEAVQIDEGVDQALHYAFEVMGQLAAATAGKTRQRIRQEAGGEVQSERSFTS